jgi:hypothetical protein
MNYEFLQENAEKLAATAEGTVFLYRYNSIEYVVLQDDTVITREKDNELGPEQAFFPY